MESPNHGGAAVPHGSGSRPAFAFPVGTAILLLVIFSLSGIFSFCYHCEKRRHAISRRTARALDVGQCKPQGPHMAEIQCLPVIVMPGDNVPKFIALPSPCEAQRLEKIIVDVPAPPRPAPKPFLPALPLI